MKKFFQIIFMFFFSFLPITPVMAAPDYPLIINYRPLAGDQGAGIDTVKSPITITFDRPMNAATINTSTFYLKDSNNNLLNTTVTYDSNTRVATLTLNPASTKLNTNQVYTVFVIGGVSGIKDSNNNPLPGNFQWSFATGTSDYFVPHRNYSTSTAKCGICHQLHQALEYRLVRNSSTSTLCFTCHDGSASNYNIKSLFAAGTISFHPVAGISLAGNSDKLRCVDCHNPHNVNDNRPLAPAASGALSYSRGVAPPARPAWSQVAEGDWNYKISISYQYELCYRCHSTWDPANPTHAALTLRDIAREFNPNNKAFHPVEADSPNTKGIFVSGYSASTRIFCTDCHGSPVSGAARGPHGSTNVKILKGVYDNNTGTGNSQHLCFRCHNYNAYAQRDPYRDSNLTGFYNSNRGNLHAYHTDKLNSIRCQYCHSAVVHGLNSNKHLILNTSLESNPYKSSIAKITYYQESSGNYSANNCRVNDTNLCSAHSN
ncbi:cytochrome c3 family protein [Carboxydocella sp. JDF658]|uniref:cytochrome c3 family protein n=1 Tax=Carboxydocella sp. JDF658 TaxID=1926600 RepID=UPI0009AC73AE|nr:cytochrome c3 family protein [Carboxydocella sp. JDF658]GAW31451.1 hypothetical protein JDF658_12160 [Carboxydocella sp. JDF658]